MASSTSNHYNAIIIGSGQAGTPLASAFQKAGHRTLLIDRAYLGGCCVNVGCTPTKTLIASGRSAYAVGRSKDYGVLIGDMDEDRQAPILIDQERVRQRKRDIVDSFRGGSERRVKDAGVEVVMGEASFVDKQTIRIVQNEGGEKFVTGDKIFINVGERPAPPSLPGIDKLDENLLLDSTSIQELDHVPNQLIVVGGGYVGVEFAQLFKRLGSQVTIVQRGRQILPREDPEIAEALLKILSEDKLKIHLDSQAVNISPPPPLPKGMYAGFVIKIDTPVGEIDVLGSHILFAAGRIPNTESLNLSAAGVKTNSKGYIECNEYLETSTPNIYALGDAKGPPAFTHISYDDFRIISHNLLSPSPITTKLNTTNRLVPYVVYTDPQLGHVGLHENEARAKFPRKKLQTAKMPMSYVARALETDESRGLMKAVVDAESGQILGFTCLGMEGGELMAVVQMAMMGKVRWEVLRDAVWAHPSLAESLNNLWGFLEEVPEVGKR